MKNSTKKLTLSALAATIATCAFAQNPKSCDLALTLVTPGTNTVYNYNDEIMLKFDLKNNGPAAIAATDTIFYHIPLGGTQGTVLYKTGVAIANGASTTVDLGAVATNANTTGTDQTAEFCITLLAQSNVTVNGNPATITYTDAVETNDKGCNNITLKTNTTGIFDTKTAKETLSLFPNPATSKVGFSIALDKAETVSAIVRDLTGREVLTKDFGQMPTGNTPALELNITNLNSGIYVVEVMAGDKKFMGKVTKKD